MLKEVLQAPRRQAAEHSLQVIQQDYDQITNLKFFS